MMTKESDCYDKKMLFIGLILTLIIALNGCYSDDPQPEDTVAEVPNSSFSESEENTESETTMETSTVQNEVIIQEETEYSKDIAETATTTVSATTETPKSNGTEKNTQPEKTEKPVETTKPKEDIPSTTEPKIENEPESETKSEPPAETKETEVKEPETQVEAFDIDYWIAYAKSYATSIGLELDVTAVECWDNPIAANPKCTTIEENIKSRLNRYKNVEEFTAVWIWAEKVSDNGYELYIGYA